MATPSKSGYITGSMWERILIIVFSCALIMIGSTHFKEPYGGIINYMRNKSAQFLGSSGVDESPYGFSSVRARLRSDWQGSVYDDDMGSYSPAPAMYESDGNDFRLKESQGRILPMPQNVRRAVKSGNISRLPKIDEVGERNRRQLDQLINDY